MFFFSLGSWELNLYRSKCNPVLASRFPRLSETQWWLHGRPFAGRQSQGLCKHLEEHLPGRRLQPGQARRRFQRGQHQSRGRKISYSGRTLFATLLYHERLRTTDSMVLQLRQSHTDCEIESRYINKKMNWEGYCLFPSNDITAFRKRDLNARHFKFSSIIVFLMKKGFNPPVIASSYDCPIFLSSIVILCFLCSNQQSFKAYKWISVSREIN